MPEAAGIYYHAYEGGDAAAPAVVLIHGAGSHHLYWPSEIRRLSNTRVYALDLPGHGKSEGCGQQTISAYSEAVLEWMSAVGVGRAVLVGHSMGSAVALTLAIQRPEQVLGLGLVGGGARLRVNPTILADSAGASTYFKAVEAITRLAFSESANPRLLEQAGKRMSATRHSVLHGDLLACNDFDLLEQINVIDKPTLVVCGAEDRLAPLRFSQYLAQAIPQARLVVIPEAGHMVMLEKPRQVAAALLEFLKEIPS